MAHWGVAALLVCSRGWARRRATRREVPCSRMMLSKRATAEVSHYTVRGTMSERSLAGAKEILAFSGAVDYALRYELQ